MSQIREPIVEVDLSKLENLMGLSGQLITVRSKLFQASKFFDDFDKENMNKNNFHNFKKSISDLTVSLGKITSDVQSGIMQMRTVPIDGLFEKCEKKISGFASSVSQTIEVFSDGGDVELDKKVFDELSFYLDKILDIILDNSINNETEKNKLLEKTNYYISLTSGYKGNALIVEIYDKGFSSVYCEEKMKDICKGIGHINGMCEIVNDFESGKKCVLTVPTTLSIYQALIVKILEQEYAVPIEFVVEIVNADDKDLFSVDGNDSIKLRGHALSIVDLTKIFGGNFQGRKESSSSKKIVVVTDGSEQMGFYVDQLIGEREIVSKSLGSFFGSVKGLGGGYIEGNGRVNLILDPVEVIAAAKYE